jgi:hypothetical protein
MNEKEWEMDVLRILAFIERGLFQGSLNRSYYV